MWKQWVNAILGLAVIATPFIALSAGALMWTLVVAGAVIVVLSIWAAIQEQSPEYHQEQLRHSHT